MSWTRGERETFTGGEPEIFVPTPFAMLVPFVLLPTAGVGTGAVAVWAMAEGGAAYLLLAVLMAVATVALWYAAVQGYRRWFSIEVDADGMSLVGLPGVRRFRIAWADLEAVGFTQEGGTRLLAVRPTVAYPDKPFRGAARWDADRRLLGITGSRHWTPSPGELQATVRHQAGDKWCESLDEVR